jgi:tetraacyldisaccharide 4'-kinase
MEQAFRRIISGEQSGMGAAFLRGAMRLVEPIYTAVVASRNGFYSKGVIPSNRAARPVVSVGNITTGGTGKTPVVRWLADRVRQRGMHPAILLRGYKSQPGQRSDEEQLLDDLLNPPDGRAPIIIEANPDRSVGAQAVVRQHPEVDVFILDDGFQHRQLQRDFDLVLIDATNPFGFDHVLPRGLLREPLGGLARASAFLLTRVDQALPGTVQDCHGEIRRHAPAAPIYQCRHASAAVVCEEDGRTVSQPIERLRGKRVFAFCGIGNPDSFQRQLATNGATIVGRHAFGDHHHYEQVDIEQLQRDAAASGAEALVSTEKDWVKLSRLRDGSSRGELPVWRVRLEVEFVGDDEKRLLDQIVTSIAAARAARSLQEER